jgi:tRNA nucleotidyltransferase (CCA-adding enzyme)
VEIERVEVPAVVRGMLRRIGQIATRQGTPAYAVGGCVRDWLLGIKQTVDVDVVADGDGIALAREVRRRLGGSVTEHAQFGTSTLRLGSRRVDFASCRRETYATPGAYPKVSPGTLREDLFRRDFTVNAMAVALSPPHFGTLVDPYGGRSDLGRRRLRVLHGRSFQDDPSRILRGVRFARRFALRWDPGTRRALRQALCAGALGWLNAGRWHKELERMLEEPQPRACLEDLARLIGEASPDGRRAAAA